MEPQTVNKARLYSMELRLNEVEEERQKGETFYKESLKRLIFAIEQSLISKDDYLSSSIDNPGPRLMST